MKFIYRIYGLTVASGRQLPFPSCATKNSITDVQIVFSANCPEEPPPDGFFVHWQSEDGGLGFCTRLTGGCGKYVISGDGHQIQVSYSEKVAFLDAIRYVTGVSLGAALRFQGVLCLHASAVAVNGSALVFAGPSRAGKSSLSAAFHRRGFSLISEDVVALDEHKNEFFVRPGYAGVRLCTDTLDLLYGSRATTEAAQVEQKYLHRLDAIPTSPLPVRALYLLAPRDPHLLQPRVTLIDKQSALLTLGSQFYLHRFGPKAWLARDFPRLGKLVQQLPVYLLERPDALSSLDATIDLILAQQESVEPHN